MMSRITPRAWAVLVGIGYFVAFLLGVKLADTSNASDVYLARLEAQEIAHAADTAKRAAAFDLQRSQWAIDRTALQAQDNERAAVLSERIAGLRAILKAHGIRLEVAP